jgi:SulP family sulfate permease
VTTTVLESSRAAAARIRRLLPTRQDWRDMRRHPRADLTAGLTVAVVALPLALAFGAASGLGARAGLITAIVAGALAAIFGGSNLQVSGPTGAMTVVLIPVVHRYGVNGVLLTGLLAGAVLVVAAFLRLGRAARYLPSPVVEGFTAGIAVVIVLQQVPAMLGTPGAGDKAWQSAWHSAGHYLHHPQLAPLAVTLAVAAVILLGTRWRPAVPVSLAVVAAATLVVALLHVHLATLGRLPAGLPAPSTGFVKLNLLATLAPSALAVAALGALESLLSATVADGMTVGQHHDADRELFGQGIANLVVPLFGGVPATGAIARTAVNARVGARSRLSALTHAAGLALIVLVAAPLVGHIPLAALAGVLLATCIQMVEVGSLLAIARATRPDALILTATLVVTVAFNLVTAVAVGIAIAVVLALRTVTRSARLDEVALDAGDHDAAEHQLLAEHIVAYRIDGPLFFAAAHRFLLELSEVAYIQVVILRLSRITALDATGAKVLGDAITRLERRGIIVLLSGIKPHHDQVLSALGVVEHLRGDGLIFTDTPAAIRHARSLIHPLPAPPPQPAAPPQPLTDPAPAG